MEQTSSRFGTLTPRMKAYREALLSARPQVCAERAMLTTESYRLHADKPVVLRRAYMLQNILEKMTIYIEPETFLAGNQASANRAAPIFPEYAMDWVIRELDEFEKRDGDVFYITEETKEQLRSIYPFWEHNTLLDRGLAAIPPESRVFYDLGIIKAEGNITSGDAHIAVAYETVLREGLKAYEAKTRSSMAALDLTDCRNLKTVRLPSTLREIFGYAFSGCTALEGIELPEGLTMLGSGAFRGCGKITGVVLILTGLVITVLK